METPNVIIPDPPKPVEAAAPIVEPVSEPVVSEPVSAPIPAQLRVCRHCDAQFAAYLSKCPGCGKDQRGAPKGPRKVTVQAPPVQAPPVVAPVAPAFVPNEKQLAQLEDALAETVTFLCEDIAAPIVLRGRKAVPPFGEKRAAKIGAAWAPLLAPYMGPGILLMLLAIAVTVRGLGSYIRELKAPAMPEQKSLPLQPMSQELKRP
jgi:hypothetical protein